MNTVKILLLLVAVGLFAAGRSVGQQKESKQGDTVEVRLNLAVRNLNGTTPAETSREQIKIFEDGVPQTITYLVRKDPKLNLGIVLDGSGSMRSFGTRIRVFAKQLIAALDRNDEAFVERFIGSEQLSLLQDWTSDQAALANSVDKLTPEPGQTAVIDGLVVAAEYLLKRAKENPSQKYALVVVSDWEEKKSRATESELYAKLAGSGIQVFVVALTEDLETTNQFMAVDQKAKAELLANRVAFNSGGAAYFPKSLELGLVLNPLMNELRSEYVVGYASTNRKRSNDKRRKLRVEVATGEKGESRVGVVREYFVAPKN